MNPAATRHDFARQKPAVQQNLLTVLEQLRELGMACRCEMVGSDFTLIVGRGYSAAKFWIDQFTRELD